ncbi:TetR/AcrR family transcriptional regulator [soil metagenome]
MLNDTPRSAAQQRIMAATLDLIAEHGVSGTSLQMIADAIGVTKAAVYHQFRTKDDIVIAVTADELSRLEDALLIAEAEASRQVARKVLLNDVIEMTVARRRWVATLQFDPVIIRLLGEHEPFRLFMTRLYAVLLDEDDDLEARVSAAVISAAIAGAVANPLIADVDDDILRSALLNITKRMLDLPE